MRVSIKLTADAAAELCGEAPRTERSRRLEKKMNGAGVDLQPMHPGVDDPELRTYFSADVDDDSVDRVLEELRDSEDIEGAYVKPPDALP